MTTAVFYRHFAGESLRNMAVDEWLAARASLHPGQVFLRLYTWASPTITLGMNQRAETALDPSRLGNTTVIRRVTGGRAIFHEPSELTYAVAANRLNPGTSHLEGSLRQTSEWIAAVLIRFLKRLGIESRYVRQSSATESQRGVLHTTPCFESVARHEIITHSGKIIASAQRRTRSALLQHGSIKLGGVALHRALPGRVQRSYCALPAPFTRKQFDRAATLFAQEVGVSLEVPVTMARLNAEALREIQKRERDLKENPLARRTFL
ncbi:MAG: hypothetical protein ABII79_06875 [bacterium]